MTYQVLARKYRPQRFEDVVGQHGVNPSTPTYASTVDVRAVLAGSFDEPTLRLTPLGWLSASCTGGSRLL